MSKILVVYGSVGLGHKVVAENIAAVLKTYPEVNVVMLDVLEMYRGPLTETSAKIYEWIIKHLPGLWGFFYSNPVFLKLSLPLRLPMAKMKIKKYQEFVEREKPDLILTTHPTATALTINLKRLGIFTGPVVTTFSDFHFQPFWVYPLVDRYLVMTSEQQQEVMKLGFAQKRIIITGLPVDPLFTKEYDPAEVYRNHHLSHTRPIVLLMGGSRGWGVKLENIKALLASELDFQIVVVTGMNQGLFNELSEAASQAPQNLKVFGQLGGGEIAELFAVAKILVTKPGGLTIAQALLKNLPMVLVNPLPVMEERNAGYLAARGVGLPAKNSEELVRWVERLLKDKKFYSEMRDRTRQLARPDAARRAAQAVIDML